jgi:hypothetical protein
LLRRRTAVVAYFRNHVVSVAMSGAIPPARTPYRYQNLDV